MSSIQPDLFGRVCMPPTYSSAMMGQVNSSGQSVAAERQGKVSLRLRVLSESSLAEWSSDHDRGLVPGVFPYGMEHLNQVGIELHQAAEPSFLKGRLCSKLREIAEHRYGAPLTPMVMATRGLTGYDACAAVLERSGLAYGRLRALGVWPFSRVPLVMISCWLAQWAVEADSSRLRVLRKRLEGVDMITYWSRNQAHILADTLGVPEHKLFHVPFGVESDFYCPRGLRRDFILAAGKDHGRDYRTFLEAVADLDTDVVVLCADWNIEGLRIPPNVTVLGVVDHLRYRALLQEAALVVTCVNPDYVYPTGQSVLLQSMSCGAPNIVTSTVPLSDYARDGIDTVLIPPRDPAATRHAILDLLGNDRKREMIAAGGRLAVEDRFNAHAMWKSIGEEIVRRFG